MPPKGPQGGKQQPGKGGKEDESPETELLPEVPPPPLSQVWFLAWLHLMRFVLEHGVDVIGELSSDPEQNVALPLIPDAQAEASTVRVTDLWPPYKEWWLPELRVLVEEAYEYGTGTKRTGRRTYRDLPPCRYQGRLMPPRISG
ncbi:unnamed protein product [Symbiodinium sp. CCMP2456]|nr:unnamed protein product [Symbiodinium sp. CCMP2456]